MGRVLLGGKEPRFRNRDLHGELPGMLAPVADVVSKPRFLSNGDRRSPPLYASIPSITFAGFTPMSFWSRPWKG